MPGTNDQIILSQVLDQKRAELAPDVSEDEFFQLFVAEQVLKDYDLSYDELEAGIVGSGGDGGIDGFFVFANGEFVAEDFDYMPLKKAAAIDVVILQAKRTAGFGETAIEKLQASCEDLLNLSKPLDNLRDARGLLVAKQRNHHRCVAGNPGWQGAKSGRSPGR